MLLFNYEKILPIYAYKFDLDPMIPEGNVQKIRWNWGFDLGTSPGIITYSYLAKLPGYYTLNTLEPKEQSDYKKIVEQVLILNHLMRLRFSPRTKSLLQSWRLSTLTFKKLKEKMLSEL